MAYRLLTHGQAEFVRLTCAGRSLREVAAAVGVEVVTVRALLFSVRTRLKTHPIADSGDGTCPTP